MTSLRTDSRLSSSHPRLEQLGTTIISLLLLLFLMGAALVAPTVYDEGWVYYRAGLASETGVNLEYFWPASPATFQGVWHEALLGLAISAGASVLDLRLAIAIVDWIVWLIIIRTIEVSFFRLDFVGKLALSSLFLSLAVPHLVTLRPEPLVGVLGLLAGIAFVDYWLRPNPRSFFYFALAAGSAVTIHQTGLLFVGPSVLIIFRAYKYVKNHQASIFEVLIFGGIAAGTFLGLLFQQTNFALLLREIRLWSSRPGYGVASEFDRWVSLFEDAGWRWWPLLIALLVISLNFLNIRLFSPAERAVNLYFVSFVAGLLLTTSKWTWHVGAIVPLVVLIFGVTLGARSQTIFRNRTTASLIGFGLPLFLGFAMIAAWGKVRRGSDFAVRYHVYGWAEKVASENLMQWAAMIVVIASAALLAFWWPFSERVAKTAAKVKGLNPKSVFRAVSGFIASLILLLPLAAYMGSLAADFFYTPQKWSLAKQAMSSLFDDFACGLSDEGKVASDLEVAGKISGGQQTNDHGPLGARVYSLSQGKTEFLLFKPDPDQQYTFWITTRATGDLSELGASASIVVEGIHLKDSGGSEFQSSWDISPTERIWTQVSFSLVETAAAPKIFLAGGEMRDYLVTDVYRIDRSETWTNLMEGSSVSVDPGLIGYFPCASLSTVTEDRLETSKYAITSSRGQLPPRWDTVGGELVEVGRLRSRGDVYVVLYEVMSG